MVDPVLIPIYKVFHPAVNVVKPKLYAAQNFVNGEVVGKFYHTFTNTKFFNWVFKETLTDEDYTFSLVSSNPAFAVSGSGVITVADITQFTETQTLTIRVQVGTHYHQDGEVEIIYVPTTDAVYLDFTNNGTATGSREQPYKRFRSYQSANPSVFSQGKVFFYKSGTTTTLEYMTFVNLSSDPWTGFARWGTGAKPIIDLNGDSNLESNRFMNFGSSSDSSQIGNNVRICELRFVGDCSNNIYPFRLRGQSGAFEIYNSEFHGTVQRQGFIWCPVDGTTIPGILPKNRIFMNLEFSDFREQTVGVPAPDGSRCIKPERGGNIIHNCKAVSTFSGKNSAPFSPVDQTDTELRFCYIDTQTANNNRGPNIRVSRQTMENCYVIGPNEPYAIANNTQNGFQVDYPVDGTSWIKNCIAENGDKGISFFNTENTGVAAPATAVGLFGVVTIGCGMGIEFGNGVRNVVAKSCLFIDSVSNGIRHSSGTGNGVENCVSVGSGGSDINVTGSMTAKNTIYGTKAGTLVETTNSTNLATFLAAGNYMLAESSPLIGAGTPIAGLKDALGVDFLNPPSIGAFEFVSEPAPPETFTLTLAISPVGFGTATQDPTGDHTAGANVTLAASAASGKQFVGWSTNGVDVFSASNPLVYATGSADQTITAIFEDIPVTPTYNLVLSVSPVGFGTIAKSPETAQEADEAYTLTATPASGKQFVRFAFLNTGVWQQLSTSNPYNGTITANLDVRAEFENVPPPPTYELDLVVDPVGAGTVSQSPDQEHASGDLVGLEAFPDSTKLFDGWYDGDLLLSKSNPYIYTTTAENKTLTAKFIDKPEPDGPTFIIARIRLIQT
jgi:hypothetical protein